MSLFHRAKAVSDWYEAAIVLFRRRIEGDTTIFTIVAVRVVRGNSIADFKTERFEIPSLGNYVVAFFAGSYDQTGGTVFGNTMTVGEVSVSTP